MSLAAHHPVILIVIPLGFAALCPLLGLWRRAVCFWWALIGSVATAFFTWSLIGRVTSRLPVTYSLGDWSPPWGIQLRVDLPALFIGCAVTAVVALLIVYSYRPEGGSEAVPGREPYYYALMLLTTAGMLGLLVTDDIFNFLVFLEIACVAAVGLVAISGKARALKAAFRFLLAVAASAALFLLAIGLLYSVTGTLDMRKMALQIQEMSSGFVPVAVVAMVVFALALAVESALFPASWWLPDAATEGRESAGALLAGLVVAMGAFGIFRLLFVIYPPTVSKIHFARIVTSTTLAWIGVIAFVAGALLAAFQSDLKRLAAYSGVSQVGLVITGISASTSGTMAGGLYAIVAGACSITCLFLAAAALISTGGGHDISGLRGIGRSRPVAATAFTLGALSFVGIPFTAGFTAKRLLMGGLLDKGWYVPASLVIIGSVVALAYCARVVYTLFAKRTPEAEKPQGRVPLTRSAPAAVLGLSAIALGILSYLITPALLEAARFLLHG
ncbi:MAG: proton-conducting transporter transmembrane domain-containing protein [Candidatus Geothermincolia bacterium]